MIKNNKTQKDERVYLVIEYKERFTNKNKMLVVRYPNQQLLDSNTMAFETKEQLAALYYQWCSINTNAPLRSLVDMFYVDSDTELGKYLTNLLLEKMLYNGLKDTSFDIAPADNKYRNAKVNSYTLRKEVKLMADRKPTDKVYEYCDGTPLIVLEVPKTEHKRVRR